MVLKTEMPMGVDALYRAAEPDFERYEMVKDLVDECIDLALNYRQSGHPGGSRSKATDVDTSMNSSSQRIWSGSSGWE